MKTKPITIEVPFGWWVYPCSVSGKVIVYPIETSWLMRVGKSDPIDYEEASIFGGMIGFHVACAEVNYVPESLKHGTTGQISLNFKQIICRLDSEVNIPIDYRTSVYNPRYLFRAVDYFQDLQNNSLKPAGSAATLLFADIMLAEHLGNNPLPAENMFKVTFEAVRKEELDKFSSSWKEHDERRSARGMKTELRSDLA